MTPTTTATTTTATGTAAPPTGRPAGPFHKRTPWTAKKDSLHSASGTHNTNTLLLTPRRLPRYAGYFTWPFLLYAAGLFFSNPLLHHGWRICAHTVHESVFHSCKTLGHIAPDQDQEGVGGETQAARLPTFCRGRVEGRLPRARRRHCLGAQLDSASHRRQQTNKHGQWLAHCIVFILISIST